MPEAAVRALPRRARWADGLFTAFAWACGAAGLALPLLILGHLLWHGLRVLSPAFLSDIPRGFPQGTAGGIWPAILGSLSVTGLGLLLAFPAALLSAVYLSEFASSPRLVRIMRAMTECLAGVPSIVFGLFGYAFFVVFLRFGISLRAGAATLALVMYPILLIGFHAGLQAVDGAYREAALALGVSRAYYVRRVLVRKAWPAIVAATVLALVHALGSAAPVLFTASVYFSKGGVDLAAPVMTLPTHLYYLVSEAVSLDYAYGTAAVLVLGMLALGIAAGRVKRLGAGT